MQIVAPLQPGLLSILQSIDAESELSRPQGYPLDHPPETMPPHPLDAPQASMDLDSPTHVNGHAQARTHTAAGLNGHAHVREYETAPAPGDRNAPIIVRAASSNQPCSSERLITECCPLLIGGNDNRSRLLSGPGDQRTVKKRCARPLVWSQPCACRAAPFRSYLVCTNSYV